MGCSELDVLTTSVGRTLIRETFDSFLRCAKFSGRFRFIVTIDPTYGVTDTEVADTLGFLDELPARDERVASVVVERFERNLGLQRSLLVAFAHSKHPVGFHLEDDWRFLTTFDLDALIEDLHEQKATLIALRNTHVSARGTFDRPGECQPVSGSRVALCRLLPPSWASDYLPLCPHVHLRDLWLPAYVRALMTDDDPETCFL
jgi:hypothetical protein